MHSRKRPAMRLDLSKRFNILAEVFGRVYGNLIPEALAEKGVHAELRDVLEEGRLIDDIRGKNVLVVTVANVSKEVIEKADSLNLIQRVGVGVDNIDVEAATRRGILVCNTPTAMTESVAQHIWGFITAHSKRIVEGNALIKAGGWRTLIGYELQGKCLGLIGLGNIGQRTAEIAHAFKMKVVSYDPYQKEEVFLKSNVERAELKELLQKSDIVALTLPLTPETKYMIGEEELRSMKKNALLINVSRGGIVKEEALVKALKEGWISGAALDVFEQEPPVSNNPLVKLENIMLTPHSAGSTFESLQKAANMAAENVARFIKGEKPYWIINPKVLDQKRDL
ncbi:MAG: phosphoglycerate dehydrogenase [Nitrososphaerales archaeon]